MDGRVRTKSIRLHRQAPNRLLQGLVFGSLVVHAILFVHITGIYRADSLTYIELSLSDTDRPARREIPRPRLRPKKRLAAVPPANLAPMPQVPPLAMAPPESNLPDSLMEGLAAPQVPSLPGVEDTGLEEGSGAFATPADYLDMVRMKIESRKRYPPAAKAKNIQGRVMIRFILERWGSVREVSVTGSSGNAALDRAAIAAVQNAAPFPRPPRNLFKDDLPLELAILFELT